MLFSRSCGSIISKVIRYRLERSGIESRWRRGFPCPSGSDSMLTEPPVQWVPVLSRSKAAGVWWWPPTPFYCRDYVWVGATLSPPLCACMGMSWGDIKSSYQRRVKVITGTAGLKLVHMWSCKQQSMSYSQRMITCIAKKIWFCVSQNLISCYILRHSINILNPNQHNVLWKLCM